MVCEVIRRRSQVPIIMLTALSDEENQLRGFEQQIDDYIPKPFSPKILLCKIAAILRRRTAENQNQSLLTYKELSMDVDGFHVYQGGNEVVLTSKEFALLRLMFILEAKENFGSKGAKEAQEVLGRVNSLFAGGELDEDAKDVFFQAIMSVYMDSKKTAREKYTPKKYRKHKDKE